MENTMKVGKALFIALFVIVLGYLMLTYHITPMDLVNSFGEIVREFGIQ